jgi:hypothetical protein
MNYKVLNSYAAGKRQSARLAARAVQATPPSPTPSERP